MELLYPPSPSDPSRFTRAISKEESAPFLSGTRSRRPKNLDTRLLLCRGIHLSTSALGSNAQDSLTSGMRSEGTWPVCLPFNWSKTVYLGRSKGSSTFCLTTISISRSSKSLINNFLRSKNSQPWVKPSSITSQPSSGMNPSTLHSRMLLIGVK